MVNKDVYIKKTCNPWRPWQRLWIENLDSRILRRGIAAVYNYIQIHILHTSMWSSCVRRSFASQGDGVFVRSARRLPYRRDRLSIHRSPARTTATTSIGRAAAKCSCWMLMMMTATDANRDSFKTAISADQWDRGTQFPTFYPCIPGNNPSGDESPRRWPTLPKMPPGGNPPDRRVTRVTYNNI